MNNDTLSLSLYEIFRPSMKTGDMLEFASDTALGGTIRWLTGRKVNHTALLVNPEKYEEFENRIFLLEALEHGVQPNILSERLRKFNGKVYWSHLKDRYDSYRPEILAWALSKVGTGYDYENVMVKWWKRGIVKQDDNKLFCSELNQMALANAGLISKTIPTVPPGGFDIFMLHEPSVRIL